MPTQTDEARDFEFVIKLIYEWRRKCFQDGVREWDGFYRVNFIRLTRAQFVQRLAQFLMPGCRLLIGHSESLNGLNIGLRCLKPNILKKA